MTRSQTAPPPPATSTDRRTGTPRITLLPDRERSLQRRHPWVFSGAVARTDGDPAAGDTVELRSAKGGFLGWAAFSPDSRIRARVWDFHESARIDAAFFAERVRWAVAQRDDIVEPGERPGIRLVHGEADGLPGVVVDRFGDCLVVQLSSAGAVRWREAIVDALVAATGIERVFERSDAEVMALEGIQPRVEALRGGAPDERVVMEEAGLVYEVDIRQGHKTGFYLDQRDSRAAGARVRECRRGARLLLLFRRLHRECAGGWRAHTSPPSTAPPMRSPLARRHVHLNGLPEARVDFITDDVFKPSCASSATRAASST
jgi:23S rRNA (cytosine1962-C5)-methyltransferase